MKKLFSDSIPRISGIYPHLAVANEGRSETGIGMVVYWAGKLWFTTYANAGYAGDDNKLFYVKDNMELGIAPESVGGTHANRFIHEPSGQLIIGDYFIDKEGHVRVVDPKYFHGRMTGNGKHLFNPDTMVYFNSMEAGLYEVNVNTLK